MHVLLLLLVIKRREEKREKEEEKKKTTEELVTRRENFGMERGEERAKANSRCLRWELGSGGSPSPGL